LYIKPRTEAQATSPIGIIFRTALQHASKIQDRSLPSSLKILGASPQHTQMAQPLNSWQSHRCMNPELALTTISQAASVLLSWHPRQQKHCPFPHFGIHDNKRPIDLSDFATLRTRAQALHWSRLLGRYEKGTDALLVSVLGQRQG
jgi:hypothetical protein